jgi:hypothetical protein
MKIQLVTEEVELNISDLSHEEGLDVLALLVNSGAIPTDVIEETEVTEEFAECDCDCGCQDEDEDNSFPFISLQSILEEALNEAAAEEEKKAEAKQEEELPEELLEFLKLFGSIK